jgi:BNR repeat-containing family member
LTLLADALQNELLNSELFLSQGEAPGIRPGRTAYNYHRRYSALDFHAPTEFAPQRTGDRNPLFRVVLRSILRTDDHLLATHLIHAPISEVMSIHLKLVVPFVVALLSIECRIANGETQEVISTTGSGRATGYAETNKIVTFNGKTHVAWLDSNENGFEVKVRTYDHSTDRWSETYRIGPAFDNHGGPALTIDSKGYLHVVYYPHSDAMRYRKSLRPNDASEWTPETQFGPRLTYPTLIVGPDNTLYLTARRRNEGKEPWTVELFSKPEDGPWSDGTTIVRPNEGSYSQFQEAMAWGPDHKTIHMAVRMYGDTPRWSYLLGYMKSTDFGHTWQRVDGAAIKLPATKATLDPIEVVDPSLRSQYYSTSALRGSSIAVDAYNQPFVLYNTLQPNGEMPRHAWIATPASSGGWKKISLNEKLDSLPKGWGLGLPGGMVFGKDGHIFLVLTAANDVAQPKLWGTASSEVIWAESGDGGQTFTSQMVSKRDAKTAHWLPNIEKPTGFNQQPTFPSIIYLSGEKGENNNVVLQNDVIFWNRGELR